MSEPILATQDAPKAIEKRLIKDFLGAKLIDNSLRGYWCEAMLAEALGASCRIVSHGWAAWDLEIPHPDTAQMIRVQVKNSASLQTWHSRQSKPSKCSFNMTMRAAPFYLAQDSTSQQVDFGFHCEVFALCHHFVSDVYNADHRMPDQWNIFLVPSDPNLGAITQEEFDWAQEKCRTSGRPVNLQRRPESLEEGIRGRAPVKPVLASELTPEHLFAALKNSSNS